MVVAGLRCIRRAADDRFVHPGVVVVGQRLAPVGVELAPDADAAVAVVGRAAADRLRYAASIRILGVGFRAYVAAVDLLQALQAS